MKALRIILIILLGLFALPIVARLVGIAVALIKDFGSGATHASYLIGSLIGTLVICALLGWLIAYLWKQNKRSSVPPKTPDVSA